MSLSNFGNWTASLSDERDGIDILINDATLITNKPFDEYEDQVRVKNQPLKARMQPADVAYLVRVLVSPAAAMISGQTIAIDGGW